MYTLLQFNETPPNQWKFHVAETNRWVPDPAILGATTFHAYQDLHDAVLAHYKANHIPVPGDLDSRMGDQICRSIPGRFCADEHGRRRHGQGWVFNMASIKQGTATLVDWFLTSREKVSNDEIATRSKICSNCSFNQLPSDCASCGAGGLNALIETVTGHQPLPGDAMLKSCFICGCNLKVKTRLPTELLRSHMPQDQLDQLPSHCWLFL